MNVVDGSFGKKKKTVKGMLQAVLESIGDLEEQNPDLMVQGCVAVYVEGLEFLLASNNDTPDQTNMLLDMGKYHLLTMTFGMDFEDEEDYDGPLH